MEVYFQNIGYNYLTINNIRSNKTGPQLTKLLFYKLSGHLPQDNNFEENYNLFD